MKIKFEYDTIESQYTLSVAQLNTFGEVGWELVGFVFCGGEAFSLKYVYIFKRQIKC